MKTFTTVVVIAGLALAACSAREVEVAANTTTDVAANVITETAGEVLNPSARPPAADGATCGGIAAIQCGASSYCDMAGPNLGAPDAAGLCKPKPDMCTEQYQPVCGTDGKTYGNACAAAAAGATVASQGECAK